MLVPVGALVVIGLLVAGIVAVRHATTPGYLDRSADDPSAPSALLELRVALDRARGAPVGAEGGIRTRTPEGTRT